MDCSQTLNCYTLLFLLYIVEHTKWTTGNQQIWIIDDFDVRQTLNLVNLIQQSPGTDPWHVYTMLGSYAFAAQSILLGIPLQLGEYIN
jgi:hypothetical protein